MASTLIVRLNSGSCPRVIRLALTKSKKSKTFRSLYCLGYQQVVNGAQSSGKNFRILSTSARFYESSSTSVTTTPAKALETKTEEKPELPLEEEDDFYRERYIPVTRQSIIRYLMQERDFLTDEERKIFPDFSLALDSAILNKYHGVLEQIKNLFDPINPDKDTIKTREWSRREKLDNEFWLLQQLEDIMDKANFHELPKAKVNKYLKEHETGDGVKVSVDPDRYDVLRFWVLGHEVPEVHLSLTERIMNKILRRPPRTAMEYYKRVVVAIRLKRDSKLLLKAFKEVPVRNIEMLLPDGTIQMNTMDRGILVTSASIAVFGVFAKLVTVLAHLNFDWTLLLTLVTGTIGFRVWSAYKNRRNTYLVDLSRTLYFKNIANNRGLLTMLVDRAEDETFKEALLTYAFLLQSRPSDLRQRPVNPIAPSHLATAGGLTAEELDDAVEEWIEKKTGVRLEFDSDEAALLLKNLGLLYEKDDKMHVLSLNVASRILPQSPQSVIAKGAGQTDILEGFDRDEYLETEEEYKEEESKRRKYGWF